MRAVEALLAAVAGQLAAAIVLLALLRWRKKRSHVARVACVVPCDHISPPPSPIGSQDQWWHTCPGCTKTFETYRGYSTHMGMDRTCASLAKLRERQQQQDGPSSEEKQACEGLYKSDIGRQVNWDLSELRVGRLIGAANTDHIKLQTRLWLDRIEEELVRRVEGREWKNDVVELRQVVHEVLDIFAGQRTEAQEMRLLRSYVPVMEVKERKFGARESHTIDAEGFRVGRARRGFDVGYDIPLAEHVERLVQHDKQAWQMIQATQKDWAERRPASGTASEVIYVDIPDGDVFLQHPAFGKNERLNKPGAPIQLGCCLSYDDVTFNNALSFARGHNKLGIITMTLVNLDLSVRNALEYIMPVCIFNHVHAKTYGMAMIFSGADKDTGAILPNHESSVGAQLRAFNAFDGIALDAPDPEHGYALQNFRMHLLAVVADYPAAAALTPHMEGTSTRRPSRNSDWDTHHPDAHRPSSFARQGVRTNHRGVQEKIANRWKLRTLATTTAQIKQLVGLRDRDGRGDKAAVKSKMQEWGLNKLVYAVQPSLIPEFDYSTMMPDDPMHVDPDGNGRCQGYYTIYMLGRQGVSVEAINARIDAYQAWLPGQKPPHLHHSIMKGAAGGRPTAGGKWRLTASQTMHLIAHSVELLEPFVADPTALFWRCHVAYVTMHELAFRHQISESQRLHLDELIYQHQELFDAVPEYDGCKMPKHQWAQMYPVQIKRLGPLRVNWTMRSEGWYQIAKNIAESSNFKKTEKRILEIYVLRSGRALVSGKLAAIADPIPLYAGPALPVDTPVTLQNATLHRDELITRLFSVVGEAACLEVVEVSEIRFQGETFVALESWVVHQSLTIEELQIPALAQIGRIFEVSGGGLLNDLFIQVLRYTDIDRTQLAGGRMEITQAAMVSAADRREDELLLFLEQSLTPVVHHVAAGSHRFFYA